MDPTGRPPPLTPPSLWVRPVTVRVAVVAAMAGVLVGVSILAPLLGTAETTAPTSTADVGWLSQWEPFDRLEVIDGHHVGVKELERNIYAEDCAAARAFTQVGARFGSTERDEAGDFEMGYGPVCRR